MSHLSYFSDKVLFYPNRDIDGNTLLDIIHIIDANNLSDTYEVPVRIKKRNEEVDFNLVEMPRDWDYRVIEETRTVRQIRNLAGQRNPYIFYSK